MSLTDTAKQKLLSTKFEGSAPNKSGASEVEKIELENNKGAKVNYLKKCFSALVNRKQIIVQPDVIKVILQSELNIKFNSLNPTLQSVLQDSTIFFMTVWPGWKKSVEYFNGKLPFKDWFEKFVQYLMFQLNHIITNEVKYMQKAKESSIQTSKVDKETMTEHMAGVPKPDSPFGLLICGPPWVLNNLAFFEADSKY